jgi:hypothetical protein
MATEAESLKALSAIEKKLSAAPTGKAAKALDLGAICKHGSDLQAVQGNQTNAAGRATAH